MKGKTIFGRVYCVTILIFVFSSISVYASTVLTTGWIGLGGSQTEAVAIKASPSDVSGMSVSLTIAGFSSGRAILNNENWNSVSFAGQCNTDIVGAPALPLMRRFFAVSPNAAVTVTVTGVQYETFENVKVGPFQRPLLETETAETRVFAINGQIYSADRFYPAEWASVSETVVMRGVHLGMLVINPFRYNPVKGTLQAASKITLSVTYTNNNPGKAALTFPSNLEKTFKALLLNYDFMEYTMVPYKAKMNNRRATDYLIIADKALVNTASLKSLADYYNGQGHTVELKDVSTIGTTADQIKTYISSLYSSKELDYVLLVGDLPAIPHKASAYNSISSDSWYSWLEGTDQVGDVALGRLPATDEAELKDMITKTLNFQTLAAPGEWRKKSILIAHKENYPDKYTACSETIYKHQYKLQAPVMDRKYGGESATNDQVTQAINEGRIVVNYRGHGSATAWTSWCSSSYTTSIVSALANGNKTPVVFAIACLNGDMGTSSDCLAEAFMCQSQGAVAILAANDPSYTEVNHDYDRALYIGIWDNGIESMGDLRNYADADVLATGGSTAKSNAAMYIWFGDPLINVLKGSSEPFITVFSPNGGEKWEQGTTQTVTWGDNIDGNVKIELFRGGSLKETLASSTASNGGFEWKIAPDYQLGTDYKIKITSVDSTALFDQSDNDFSIVQEYYIVCPYFQSFDTLDTGKTTLPEKWEQSTADDLNWLVLSGPTPSKVGSSPNRTGPSSDHTSGSGKYVYVEASGSSNSPDKKADFITPKFNFKSLGTPTVSFWAHMFSADNAMGHLYLDIEVDGVWKNDVVHLTDNHGDNWFQQTVDLIPYKGDRVRFKLRGITGTSWCSDICIDDFRIDGTIPISHSVAKAPASFDLISSGSRIYFQVPQNGNKVSFISLTLYNLQGKLVRTLVNGTVKAGYHSFSLDKINHTGQRIAAGMYLCRMETKDFTKTITVLFRK